MELAGAKGANLKQTEKAGSFAVIDIMRFMLKNAVVVHCGQCLKNTVRRIVVICQFIAANYELTVAPLAGAWIETTKAV